MSDGGVVTWAALEDLISQGQGRPAGLLELAKAVQHLEAETLSRLRVIGAALTDDSGHPASTTLEKLAERVLEALEVSCSEPIRQLTQNLATLELLLLRESEDRIRDRQRASERVDLIVERLDLLVDALAERPIPEGD